MFRAKAPLRVSFAGGGTDVPPFTDREGGLVFNATINRYAYGALSLRDDREITVESVDFGVRASFGFDDELVFDGDLDLVKAAIRRLGRSSERGFDLFLHSNAPPGSGLGSSSSMMVVLVGLLRELQGLPLDDYSVAANAHAIERHELGIKGGYQDHYASAFGGFNFIEIEGDRVIVNPLRISDDVIHELEHDMLLYYTGRTRQSDKIIEDQTARYEDNDQSALEGLRMQKQLAVEMKNALLRRRVRDFGELLGAAWEYKKKMSPKIATPAIEEAYAEAMAGGALGGKVTGAGGGGYMLFFCPFEAKHHVAERLIKLGGRVTEFEFTHQGLVTWPGS